MGHTQFEVIILAGGKGTRLASVVSDRPKVIADVAGRPFLDRILEHLASAGITGATLSIGHLASHIRARYQNKFGNILLNYAEEETPLGTGGAIRFCIEKSAAKSFLVLNGDSFLPFEFEQFISSHETAATLGSLVLTEVSDVSRYGSVELEAKTNKIIRFHEKAARGGSGLINAGVYLLSRDLVQEMPLGKESSIEREFFPQWATRSVLVGFQSMAAGFIDIGTPQSYEQAQTLFSRG